MGTDRTLPRPPALPALYLRALLTARGRPGGALPDARVTTSDLRVDPAALAEYARRCGFAVGDVLPATYPHLLAFPLQMALMTDRRFPLALPGLVHLRNRITVHRDLRADEALDITVQADNLARHRSGTTVDLTALVTVEGRPVWEARSTYLARGVEGPPGTTSDQPLGVDVPTWAAAVWRVPADAGRRYAAVSGDVNPIHLSPVTARVFGFKRPIAHGMWVAARTLASLEGRLPGAFTVDVEFRRPLFLPSTAVLATAPVSDGWNVAVSNRRDGGVHLVGTVRAAHSEGTVRAAHPDGTVRAAHPDGTVRAAHPDGTVRAGPAPTP
jgi:acyl dehydratase